MALITGIAIVHTTGMPVDYSFDLDNERRPRLSLVAPLPGRSCPAWIARGSGGAHILLKYNVDPVVGGIPRLVGESTGAIQINPVAAVLTICQYPQRWIV